MSWWATPSHLELEGELTAMFAEMLVLEALREFDPQSSSSSAR